ncbi:SDR family NAD(P)-dependent oxidoreductase [Chloroflexota bacterium]
MYDLSGKVALVTGTSRKRGLGCGIALRLAQEGADVIVTGRNKSPIDPWDQKEGWRGLDSLVMQIEAMGRSALAITADISNSREVNAMVEKGVQEFGKIDILVNNASIVSGDRSNRAVYNVVDLSEEVWNKAIAVSLTGAFLMCKAVAKHMIKQGRGGKIVNISSMAGKRGQAGRAWYCAPKFGMLGLTQCLALELGPHNINVNAVCPGTMVTWGTRGKAIYEAIGQGLSEEAAIAKVYNSANQSSALGRPGTRDEVADVVVFLASNQSDYMTGQAINVCGGQLMAH